MSFWENLSGGTKAFIVISALLMLVLIAMRAMGPDEDAPPLTPGIPPGMARPR